MPTGVVRSRGGWSGDGAEDAVRHDDEATGGGGGGGQESSLKEGFMNREVGEGYQHRTVVRQRTGAAVEKVVDMRGQALGADKGGKRKGREEELREEDERKRAKDLKELLIKSPNLRKFKREVTRLLK